jgi:quercetin dioxygenase-like cupin family protein
MSQNQIFPKGKLAPRDFFSGEAYLNLLMTDDEHVYDLTVYDVRFEAGVRNNWHSHPAGQILLCTSGNGYYQEDGQAARALKTGDIVEIPPNAIHWHGAAPDSDFTHIGITPKASENVTNRLDPVTDEEYAEACHPRVGGDR